MKHKSTHSISLLGHIFLNTQATAISMCGARLSTDSLSLKWSETTCPECLAKKEEIIDFYHKNDLDIPEDLYL